jgi:hypothetical protein
VAKLPSFSARLPEGTKFSLKLHTCIGNHVFDQLTSDSPDEAERYGPEQLLDPGCGTSDDEELPDGAVTPPPVAGPSAHVPRSSPLLEHQPCSWAAFEFLQTQVGKLLDEASSMSALTVFLLAVLVLSWLAGVEMNSRWIPSPLKH